MQVLADILDSCGDNLDAAIKRLDQLQLTAQCSAEAQATVVASPEDSTKSSSAHPGVHQCQASCSKVTLRWRRCIQVFNQAIIADANNLGIQERLRRMGSHHQQTQSALSSRGTTAAGPGLQRSGWKPSCSRWPAPKMWTMRASEPRTCCKRSSRLC